MLVLVEDAAEAIASPYVEVGDLVRVRDALVRPVGVVELFELAQDVELVLLVPDQGKRRDKPA